MSIIKQFVLFALIISLISVGTAFAQDVTVGGEVSINSDKADGITSSSTGDESLSEITIHSSKIGSSGGSIASGINIIGQSDTVTSSSDGESSISDITIGSVKVGVFESSWPFSQSQSQTE